MNKNTATIDLHGMQRFEAECELQCFLDNLPPNITLVEVIHGIGTGVLKEMVAEFYHRKIQDRVQCLTNPGQTNFYILN